VEKNNKERTRGHSLAPFRDNRVQEDDRPEIVTSILTWQPEPSAPAFELDLAEFFEDVWRESVG